MRILGLALVVAFGKALAGLFRRGPGLRHWYPRYWGMPHYCYYCGRYDQGEQEVTDPPCEGHKRGAPRYGGTL